MKNKIFLDTNIVLDLLINGRQNSTRSQKIIGEYIKSGYILVVDSITLATISYIGERHKIWFETKEFIKNILINDDLWEVCYLDKVDEMKILAFMDEHIGTDYEDLHQYFAAKISTCECIFTNDNNFIKLDLELRQTKNKE